jgi:DNA polymerase alpha subunit A
VGSRYRSNLVLRCSCPLDRIDDPTPPERQPSISHTIVRPIGKYPPGFEPKARAEEGSKIVPAASEVALLDQFLGLFVRYDPDILVGHEFIGDHLEIVLQRLKELKTKNWSRVGRLRRDGNLVLGRQGSNVKFLTGRLVCDLTSDAAKVSTTIPANTSRSTLSNL